MLRELGQSAVGTMSWLVSEWKDGLPARALQKVDEMEKQVERLKKECQQKQFQVESLDLVCTL